MRPMTNADIDEVLRIEQAVQAYPWTRGNFTDALMNFYECSVDATSTGIRGYVIWMPILQEAELLNIGVAETWQRKGLGRAMLNGVLEAARKKSMRRVFLEVRASNAAAIALYHAVGFKRIGERRGYYQNANCSENALVLACDLMGEVYGQA